MTVGVFIESCDLKVKLLSGASFVSILPIFTYDSKNIIFACGRDVKVYNIQSGECVHTLKHHVTSIVSVCENKKNYLQFFSCSEDGCVVRWDSTEGKVLEVTNLESGLLNFFAPTSSDDWYFTRKSKKSDKIRLFCYCKKKSHNVFNDVVPDENCIAFGYNGQFIAAVHGNVLDAFDSINKAHKRHLAGERKFTCVTCHASDFIVATGDELGRVLVWSNFLESNNPIRSIYHWHSLPVGHIAFSTEGSYLYSGGGEGALVKWNMFTNDRSILPRLGAPICKVAVSSDNAYVLIGQHDNVLQIINSQKNIVQVIQGLTQGHFHGSKQKEIMPTGLLYDAQTKCLVLNGKPGHLQFYNIHEDKQLFNLDISGRNFISQERDSVVINTDVQRAAFDDKGHWLATAEYWDDAETSPQIWLKFWEFDLTKQTFILNTNVILPHNKEINCIVFQPSASFDNHPCVITTSKDGRFKTWVLKDDICFDGKLSWSCIAMGCYRDLPAGNACFSEDGSLLAVAFGNIATLWTVESTSLKAVLIHEKSSQDIVQLAFGRKSCSQLLVCHDSEAITVWNVVSLSINWIVHTKVQVMAVDPTSEIIAAFCEDQMLILFKPNDPEPVYSVENVSSSPVIRALFAPKHKVAHDGDIHCFHNKSHLFFFDKKQNLLTLTEEWENSEDEVQKVSLKQSIPLTPYGVLQPELKVSNVEIIQPELLPIDTVTNRKDIDITCPRLMDPVSLCSRTLQSLLIPVTKSETESSKPMETDEEIPCIEKSKKSPSRKKPLTNFDGITDFSFLIENLKLSFS